MTTAQIRDVALAAGAVACGVTDAEPFNDVRRDMERRMASGRAGSLGFTYRHPEIATDIRRSFEWATHLVVIATAYLPEAGSPGPREAGTGRVARFAASDHYRKLTFVLDAVATELRAHGHQAEELHDDDRLVDRASAVRAGVGWWGKNSMVLTPGWGPWILLGTVVTDAELLLETPMKRTCGNCSACLPACPTGALIEPGLLDATLCLAYWLQTAGSIPRHLRAAVGDRVYGCDDCLAACPPGSGVLDMASDSKGRIDLVDILASSDTELEAEAGHWYVPKRDMDYVRRNALVALGNSGDRDHVEIIAGWLGNGTAMMRGHAAWALGAIGGREAVRVLETAGTVEGDATVATEITAALDAAATAR